MNLIADFLALRRAGQAAKIRRELGKLNYLVVGVDGMQPEKGNKSLDIVREIQSGLTLMAESLDESSNGALSQQLFEPLKVRAQKMDLEWRGVVSDAPKSIRLAVAHSLPGVPHQACHSHGLREAAQLTFEADRTMKKQLKATIRQPLYRLEKRLATLPAGNRCRSVLLDYAQAIHSTLPEGGVAPFELGGVAIFAALEDLAASLERRQKKGSHPRLRRLLVISQRRSPYTAQVERQRRPRPWLIDLDETDQTVAHHVNPIFPGFWWRLFAC
jgi:hypothetical protein